MKILSKISKALLNIILVILLLIMIILVYNIIQINCLNKDYMNIFGYSLFQVKTGSMSGTIEKGDIIIVKITKDVKNNDIVTYQSEGSIITHRIISMNEAEIITKGDSNNSQDDPITKEQIVGKVVYTFKNVEIWKKVLMTPGVYLLIIATMILLGISISVQDNKKENQNIEQKEETSEFKKKE